MAGLTIFWADDGLDTGPILMTRQCSLELNDTLDTIYKRFLYPVGITSMAEAVDMIANGTAPKIVQSEEGASYDAPMFKEENQVINLAQPALRIYNFTRALDSVPGAIAYVEGGEEPIQVRLFGASLYTAELPKITQPLRFRGLKTDALVHAGGVLLAGTDGKYVNVQRLKKGSRMIAAGQWFEQANKVKVVLELTDAEKQMDGVLRAIWESILKIEVTDDTDFFASGAGSMDVVRLIEEAKDAFEINMENEVLFMAPVYSEFFDEVVKTKRQGDVVQEIIVDFEGFVMKENKREIKVPTQLFINGKFVSAENDKLLDIFNPTTEELLCKVAVASKNDVDNAVQAAHAAFNGPWSLMSARQRGQLMFKLADLMEQHKEELATIESVDSGAVYTLALKTHIGMSIDAWRYFAGWTDKIEGATIPVSAARPNNVLTYTKREPIGYVILGHICHHNLTVFFITVSVVWLLHGTIR